MHIMAHTKPNIFLKTDICDVIDEASLEISHIIDRLEKVQEREQWLLKAVYLYGYTIFESTLYNTYYRFLCAFPERNVFKEGVKFDENVYGKSLVMPLIESVVSKFAKQFGHGTMCELLEKYNEVAKVALNKTDMKKCALIPLLDKYKANRNTLAHQGIINDDLNLQDVVEGLKIIRVFINKIKNRVLCKYGKYDKLNLIRNSWTYLFNRSIAIRQVLGDNEWHLVH